MAQQTVRRWFNRGHTVLLVVLGIVVAVGAAAAIIVGAGNGPSDAVKQMDYKLGYDCAQSGWQVAAAGQGTTGQVNVTAIEAACRRQERAADVADRSAFQNGFRDGLAKGPSLPPEPSG